MRPYNRQEQSRLGKPMCLIALSWRSHPRYVLALAANRDEFHARATAPAEFWPEAPHVLAGRDLEAGGTWLGITRTGRVAALSNYRDGEPRPGPRSRGELVRDFLLGTAAPRAYARDVDAGGGAYGGFNLLIGEIGTALYYVNNRGAPVQALTRAVHGVSNGHLDAPWPKVRRLCAALEALPAERAAAEAGLFHALADRTRAPDAQLPDTGVGIERERRLSPAFIADPVYGTRASTVILVGVDGRVSFTERRFGPGGVRMGETRRGFALEQTTDEEM